jgi:hypothetical protein
MYKCLSFLLMFWLFSISSSSFCAFSEQVQFSGSRKIDASLVKRGGNGIDGVTKHAGAL